MINNFVLFECILSLCMLVFIWFFLFGRERRDDYRCAIRRLRNELFDFVQKNGGDFQNPAYVECRKYLHDLLRVSNDLSPLVLLAGVVLILRQRRSQGMNEEQKKESVAQDPLSQRIREVRTQATLTTLHFLFLRGLLGLFIRGLATALIGVNWTLRVKQAIQSAVSELANLPSPRKGGSTAFRWY